MASGPSTTAQTLFKSVVYRIPALLYERESKTLFAFAEQRKTPKDESTEKLVMRTGKIKEESPKKTVEWSELREVEKALIDGYRPMNPCPVYDKVNKKLFLFFICVEDGITEMYQRKCCDNRTHLCYITSEDLGKSWSDVTDLTDKLSEIENWSTFAVGPGHGIQTESGRLIIPVYGYCSSTCLLHCCCKPVACLFSCCCKPVACLFSCCCKSYALSLYSDDHGKNWKFGQMFQSESGECQMAKVYEDNGSSFIYCNARSSRSFRLEAVSDDNGVNFTILKPGDKLVETGSGCQGSVVSFPAQPETANTESDPSQNQNKWLLFTHPTSPKDRVDLGVYLNKSPRDPKAWSEPCIINNGLSGYSDLAYIDDGWFACLFERGDQKEYLQIASVVFSYKDVEEGIKKMSTN